MSTPILPSFQACDSATDLTEAQYFYDGNPPTRMQLCGRWMQWGSGALMIVGAVSIASEFMMKYPGNNTHANNGTNGTHHDVSAHDRWFAFLEIGATVLGGIGLMIGTAMVERGERSHEIVR